MHITVIPCSRKHWKKDVFYWMSRGIFVEMVFRGNELIIFLIGRIFENFLCKNKRKIINLIHCFETSCRLDIDTIPHVYVLPQLTSWYIEFIHDMLKDMTSNCHKSCNFFRLLWLKIRIQYTVLQKQMRKHNIYRNLLQVFPILFVNKHYYQRNTFYFSLVRLRII